MLTLNYKGFFIYECNMRFKIKGNEISFKTVWQAMSWINRYTFNT